MLRKCTVHQCISHINIIYSDCKWKGRLLWGFHREKSLPVSSFKTTAFCPGSYLICSWSFIRVFGYFHSSTGLGRFKGQCSSATKLILPLSFIAAFFFFLYSLLSLFHFFSVSLPLLLSNVRRFKTRNYFVLDSLIPYHLL